MDTEVEYWKVLKNEVSISHETIVLSGPAL